MAQAHSEICEQQLNGVSEEIELLHIEVFTDEGQDRPGREDARCSRNVLRKQRHWERQVAAKKSKRKEEKMRRKLNREQQTGGRAGGPLLTKRVLKAITRERLAEAQCTGLKLCVDLSMTDSMSSKEVSRLAGQLRRLYGSNRKATQPFHLFLTNLREDSCLYKECIRMNSGFLRYMVSTLETVDSDKVYILGGLVDESVQKRLSLSRATELSVHTARLPIDEYMVKKHNPKNFHSKILAINQVFDILLTFCHTGSWTEAFHTWFPQGKGYIVAQDVSSTPDITVAQS
uniref:tRNA (guanine(9)-N(1))-methyltransferase n=1 Tax=Sphaeramia orbicularis TaxID=375764 RepID=A0A673BWN9_9TELE